MTGEMKLDAKNRCFVALEAVNGQYRKIPVSHVDQNGKWWPVLSAREGVMHMLTGNIVVFDRGEN